MVLTVSGERQLRNLGELPWPARSKKRERAKLVPSLPAKPFHSRALRSPGQASFATAREPGPLPGI
jgi:hypothetical protein